MYILGFSIIWKSKQKYSEYMYQYMKAVHTDSAAQDVCTPIPLVADVPLTATTWKSTIIDVYDIIIHYNITFD
jgi:hypothetical protein